MIVKLIAKLLRLDQVLEENDREVEKLQKKAHQQIGEAVLVLKKCNDIQTRVVKRTTTFYIAQAMGVIK